MPIKYKRYLTYFIILVILFGVRIYLLDQAPMNDYDSIRNFVIAKDIKEGSLDMLFQRRIPTVHLINAGLLLVQENFLWLEYFHAFISTLAVLIFTVFISRRFHLNLSGTFLLGFILGLSPLLVNMSRYMSIESWSLLFFVLILVHYIQWLETKDANKLIWTVVFYSLATTVNYKFLFLIILFCGFEIWVSRKSYSWKLLIMTLLILATPFLIYSMVGQFSGHGFFRYIAGHWVTLFSPDHNPSDPSGSFNFDFLFYPRFILEFENPLLLLAFPWALWIYRKEIKNFSQNPSMIPFLILFTLVYILLISLVRKAPRGLLFIDLFLYLFFYLFLTGYIKKKLISSVLIAITIFYSILQINKHIYAYADTSYDKVAESIQNKGIKKIILTTGMGVIPYLDESVEWTVLFNEDQLSELIEEGYSHALLDDYRIITGMNDFNRIESGTLVDEFTEISLHSPILALEHAEFVRIGYREAMILSETVQQNPSNLKIIELN